MAVTVSAPNRARLNATAATHLASLTIGRRGARYEGPLLGVGLHASCVTCFVEALSGKLEVGRLRAKAVRIPAGVRHEVRATPGARVVFWYVEPGGPRERTIRQVSAAELRALRLDSSAGPGDARVGRVLDALTRNLEARPAALAAMVALSDSRLRHLIRAQLGVPLVRVRWWFQMMQAARVLRAGGDLSTAAHEARFSDSAHFTRTFGRMFGFAPSLLLAAGVRIDVAD
jgi:AraC-like DNA-binding protein